MEEIPESVAELFDDANGDLAVGDLPAAIEKYRKCTEIVAGLLCPHAETHPSVR